MSEASAMTMLFGVDAAACSVFLYLVLKRQWSALGLYTAIGCLIGALAHLQIPIAMYGVAGYAAQPAMTSPIVWHPSPAMAFLAAAIAGLFLAAMIAALRPNRRWSAPVICLASAFALTTVGTSAVANWTLYGQLPSISAGVPWPVWIGFPAELLLLFGPFLCAIPWSLLRQAGAVDGSSSSILARYWMMLGVVGLMLVVLNGAIIFGLLEGSYAAEARYYRGAALFFFAMTLSMVTVLATILAFRRIFLVPALRIIRSFRDDRPLENPESIGPLWRPMVETHNSTRSQARERAAQLTAFFDNLPTSIYLKTVDHEVIYVSKHLAEQYGKRPEDMVGKYEYDLHIEAMKPLLKAMDDHIMSTGQAVLTEGRHLQFDRLELVSRFPVFNDMGEITHIGGMNFDIDDRARAQAELIESKALFEAFVENAPNAMALLSSEGQGLMFNKATAAYYGKIPEQLMAMELDDFRAYFPEFETHLLPAIRRIVTDLTTESVELNFRMPTGEIREMNFSFFPVLAADGTLAYVGNIAHDMTDERRAQADLIESKALIDAFIQNAPNSMVLMEPSGRYVMYNEAAAADFGKTSAEMLKTRPSEIAARFPDAATVIVPMFERVAKSLVMESTEVKFEMLTGELHDFYFSFFPILGADGKLAYIGNISHDITAERRAQAELTKSTDALHQSEKLAALGQLLAGVSHELNNPLAAVIGQAELLAEDIEGTAHAERVGKIRRAADRCARIVQSFLAMARQKAPEYRIISLGELVRQAVELTEYQMRAASIEVEVKLDESLPAIEADADQLHQVIVNLLTNARQALEDKEGERRISITATRQRGQVKLRLTDNGKGIPPEARARIFDPFFSTKDVGSGTGIGLSYSLSIVELHGGKLELETADVGTVFALTLPVAKGEVLAEGSDDAASALTKGRALVIDDEEDIAGTLRDMLSRMGLKVTVALGGRAGQAALENGAPFDLVVSDIRMPEIDGPAMHAWITMHRPDLLGRLAFITGDTLGEGVAEFIAATACPVLEKPFRAAALRELVDRMINP